MSDELLKDPDAPSVLPSSKKKSKKKDEPKEEVKLPAPVKAAVKNEDPLFANRKWHHFDVFECTEEGCPFDSIERDKVVTHIVRVHAAQPPVKTRDAKIFDRFGNELGSKE